MAGVRPIANFTFHDNTTITGTGNPLQVNADASMVNIEFEYEAGTTFSIDFEAKCHDKAITYKKVMGANLATLDLVTTVTDSIGHNIYQIDLTGIGFLRVNITALSGTLNVYGRIVA